MVYNGSDTRERGRGMQPIRKKDLLDFGVWLRAQEKSPATTEKYMRDMRTFCSYSAGKAVDKELTVGYKKHLLEQGYSVRSINSMLASLNSFLTYKGGENCRVQSIRIQREVYCRQERMLTRQEYIRLLEAARGRPRLYLLLQTLCGTGIRISELAYFTVENVRRGEIVVRCKGKTRRVLLPKKLKKKLLEYAARKGIGTGPVFCTRSGKPLDRSNMWAEMKSLCAKAGVSPEKVFPHNLRKLFARTFYTQEKDVAKLADILGHSSIDTTRIYIMTDGWEHQRRLDSMRLVL